MNLQRESVVLIKNRVAPQDESAGIEDLPKRTTYVCLPEPTEFDHRAVPGFKDAPGRGRWITHLAIIELFLLSNSSWLFIIEDDVNLQPEDIKRIEDEATQGLILLTSDTSAYVLDKPSARTIIEQNRLFYGPLHEVFQDLNKLGLIKLKSPFLFQKIKPNSLWQYLPLILSALSASLILFRPAYRFFTQGRITLTEVLGAEESSIGGQGTGMSSHQDDMAGPEQFGLFLSKLTP